MPTTPTVPGGPPRALAAPAVFMALLLAAGCQQITIPTPTRVLDLPSDVALFCMDVEFDAASGVCLPLQGVPDINRSDPGALQAFLDAYCSYVPPEDAVQISSRQIKDAVVLPLSDCSDVGRQKQREAALGPLLDIAERLGRSRNNPCCTAEDPGCGLSPSVCKRRRLEALVTNSARGEVAVVDTDAVTPGLNTIGQIQNLHSGRPGFGFLPAGVQPEHVRTAFSADRGERPRQDYGVVTNLGSCDLSVIGLSRVAELVAGKAPGPGSEMFKPLSPATCEQFATGADRLQFEQIESCRVLPWVKDRDNPLGASPGWVEIAPWGRLRALVTYPRCGLLADVDLVSGQIKEAVALGAAGPRRLGAAELASWRCAPECGGAGGGALPAVGVANVGSLPSAVAVDGEGKRLLISDALSGALTLIDYDEAAADGQHLGAPRQLALDFPAFTPATQRGVDGVRVGPRTGAGLFAYARTRDATVRVVNLDSETECETNPDPRFLQQQAATGALRLLPEDRMTANLRALSCFPLGTPRHPAAVSAGIALPGAAVPTDVAFAQFGIPCDPADADCPFRQGAVRDEWVISSPQLFVGDFAWILGSSGRALAVQIADRCPSPSYRACDPGEAARRRVVLLNGQSPGALGAVSASDPASYALATAVSVTPQDWLGNVPRTFTSRFGEATLGPRVALDASANPQFSALIDTSVVTVQADAEIIRNGRPTAALQTRQVLPALAVYPQLPVDPICDAALSSAVLDERFRPRHMVAFPDPTNNASESWTLSWEGRLDGLSRATGQLSSGGGQGTMALADLGGLFCTRDVEPGDKVFLRGCQTDLDCRDGARCYREDTRNTQPGLCFKTEAERDRCRALSRGVTTDENDPTVWAAAWTARYRVVKAFERPSGSELRLSEIAAPESSAQRVEGCKTLGEACAGADVHLPGAQGPLARTTACRIDHDDNDQPVRRCLVECDSSNDCGPAYVCSHSPYEVEEKTASPSYVPRGRCVRAPLLTRQVPQADAILAACFPDYQRYEVRVGDAFLVSGDSSGAVGYTRATAPDGQCQRPRPGDVDYQQSLLKQPRLWLGPRTVVEPLGKIAPEVREALLCPPAPPPLNQDPRGTGWIGHRAAPPPALAGVCQRLFAGGLSGDCADTVLANPPPSSAGSKSFLCLPNQTTAALPFQRASEHLTGVKEPKDDPWLYREYELFSSLTPPEKGAGTKRRSANSCILSGWAEYTGLVTQVARRDDTGEVIAPGSLVAPACTFPGEVPPCARRIHFENTSLNLVLQLPRLTLPVQGQSGRTWVADEWMVPDDGYAVSFRVTAGGLPYSLPVATIAGQLAQGLRAATASPDGAVYVVDQGRTGTASGLRGQLMRLARGVIDANFLIR